VFVVTGAATDLGGFLLEERHDQMVRKPLALDAVIVYVITQS